MPEINKYTGPWGEAQVTHLLRRSTFGFTYADVKKYANQNVDSLIDILFREIDMPPPPINVNYENDPDVPIGETWVDKGTSAGVNGYRNASLRAWSIGLMKNQGLHIREKMTLFWHNHFVVADLNDPRFTYQYISLLREGALGNFRELTKNITINPGMLNYLNGRDNTKEAPNENYARELLELFTLGKGVTAGPGDYTTFTEQDVKEIARALTGWIDIRNELPIQAQFRLFRHDTGTKVLSHRFNNTVIDNANQDEYKNVVDVIFQREEVALFIARKLYRWFVYYKIDDDVMEEVILPLAYIIREDDYNIDRAIKTLLSSEHFYKDEHIGCMIKNPLDFLLTPLVQFELPDNEDVALNQRILLTYYSTAQLMQMGLFQAPSVAGWQAYYQEPLYYRFWLNSTSLPTRKIFTDGLSTTGLPFGQFRVAIDHLKFLNSMASPEDIDFVISQYEVMLFCKPIETAQRDELKRVALLGLSPQGFADAYLRYKANPDVESNVTPILNRMRALCAYMMVMPEYHLS